MTGVVVLNATYEPLHTVSLEHAIRMLVRKVAVVETADAEHMIGPFPKPIRLRLVRYVKMAWKYATHRRAPFGRDRVLTRDRGRCAYCGRRNASTMDHVLPRCRGGRAEWLNAVAACQPCNARKGSRTPEEAGMPLRWTPWIPSLAELAFGRDVVARVGEQLRAV